MQRANNDGVSAVIDGLQFDCKFHHFTVYPTPPQTPPVFRSSGDWILFYLIHHITGNWKDRGSAAHFYSSLFCIYYTMITYMYITLVILYRQCGLVATL